MLVEVLRIAKCGRARRALARGITAVVGDLFVGRCGRHLLARVGRRLLDTVYRGKVAFENVGSVEALLGGRPRTWAEATHHGPLVVSQGVSVLVVFAGEALDVVFARHNGALLRSLGLVREHVGLEVLEDSATVWMGAAALLLALLISLGSAMLRPAGMG